VAASIAVRRVGNRIGPPATVSLAKVPGQHGRDVRWRGL